MTFLEFVARTYCKEEASYTGAWLDAWVNHKGAILRKDRSRPIWYWALKRWGMEIWPRAEYKARNQSNLPD